MMVGTGLPGEFSMGCVLRSRRFRSLPALRLASFLALTFTLLAWGSPDAAPASAPAPAAQGRVIPSADGLAVLPTRDRVEVENRILADRGLFLDVLINPCAHNSICRHDVISSG